MVIEQGGVIWHSLEPVSGLRDGVGVPHYTATVEPDVN